MSTKFKDNNGAEWKLHLTLGIVKEINDELGVNLLAPWDGKAIDEFVADPLRLAIILTKAVTLNDEQQARTFAEGLRGEGLDNAIAAFYEDLASFFPAGQRRAFAAFMRVANEAQTNAWDGVKKMLVNPGTPS